MCCCVCSSIVFVERSSDSEIRLGVSPLEADISESEPGRICPLEAGNPSRAPARSWGRPLEPAGCLRACCGPLPPSMLWLAAVLSLGLSSVRLLRGVGTQKPSYVGAVWSPDGAEEIGHFCSRAFTLYSAAILEIIRRLYPQGILSLLVWRFVFWFRVLGKTYTNFSAQCGPDLGSSYA